MNVVHHQILENYFQAVCQIAWLAIIHLSAVRVSVRCTDLDMVVLYQILPF